MRAAGAAVLKSYVDTAEYPKVLQPESHEARKGAVRCLRDELKDRGARGDEHPIGPPRRGLTQPTETRVFPNPGPLEGPGSLWKLPQSESKPDRDQISTRDKIPPEFYPEKLRTLGISPEVMILGTS